MTSDARRLIQDLYHEALARQPGERSAFLKQACAGDQALRREVEALLAQRASHDGMPAAAGAEPPPSSAGGGTGPDTPRLQEVRGDESALLGSRIGVYRIDSILGIGGMGEVYRARDTRLER